MTISFNTTLTVASSGTRTAPGIIPGAVALQGNLTLFAQQLSQTAMPAPAAVMPVTGLPDAPLAALPSQLGLATVPGMSSWQADTPADPAPAQDDAQTAEQHSDGVRHSHIEAPLEGLLPAMASPVITPRMPVQTEPLAADEQSPSPDTGTAPAMGLPASLAAAPATNAVVASSFAAPPAAAPAIAQALPATNTMASPEPGSRPASARAVAPSADESARNSPFTVSDPAANKRGNIAGAAFAAAADSAPAAPAVVAVAASTPAALRDGDRTAGNAATSPATANSPLLQPLNSPPAAGGNDTIKLNGPAQQWQEPLREALGERLQTQIGRNSEHAVIRLDPPMLGRIEISIRHQAGALQVNLSASNTEVLRQLQGIGENMRNDLAQRQYTDVAVNINATPRSPAAQTFAEHDGRGQRQPGRQHDDAEPGRALSDGAPAGATFAMHEREYN